MDSSTPNAAPITEESVENIAVSINTEQKEKRQLNLIIHNLKESTANEGPSRKEDDIARCKSLFQTYLGAT